MIPIQRQPLPESVARRLARKTESLQQLTREERAEGARKSWRNSDGSRTELTRRLNEMASGRQCCMYCSDGQGTSIDHYEPINTAPEKTWEWENHILACTVCNSHNKREKFPLSVDGEPLFLNPTVDDPFDHLILSPSTGRYVGSTDRGEFTADELLNRELLERGRIAAWHDAMDHIQAYALAVTSDDVEECRLRQFRLTQRPNLDAFYCILRYVHIPPATIMIPADVVEIVLRYEVEFFSWLGLQPN